MLFQYVSPQKIISLTPYPLSAKIYMPKIIPPNIIEKRNINKFRFFLLKNNNITAKNIAYKMHPINP